MFHLCPHISFQFLWWENLEKWIVQGDYEKWRKYGENPNRSSVRVEALLNTGPRRKQGNSKEHPATVTKIPGIRVFSSPIFSSDLLECNKCGKHSTEADFQKRLQAWIDSLVLLCSIPGIKSTLWSDKLAWVAVLTSIGWLGHMQDNVHISVRQYFPAIALEFYSEQWPRIEYLSLVYCFLPLQSRSALWKRCSQLCPLYWHVFQSI